MAIPVRQASFAGGEISRAMSGRSDLAKYHVAVRRMRNFFASQQGQAVSRPGSLYVGEVKDSSAKVRLVPFVYSDAVAFLLEFGNQYIRVWQNDTLLGEISSGSGYANFVVPYLTADLPKLKYAQTGAVLTLCHGGYPPAELTWSGSAWTYAALSFDRPTPSIVAYVQAPIATGTPPLAGGVYQYASGSTYATDDYVLYKGIIYRSLDFGNTGNAPDTAGSSHWVRDDATPGREWQYMATELRLDSRSQPYESKGVLLTQAILFYQPFDSRLAYFGGSHGVGTQVTSSGKDIATGAADGGTPGTTYRCILSNKGVILSNATYWAVDNTIIAGPPRQVNSLPPKFNISIERPVLIDLATVYANHATDKDFIGNRIYRGFGGTWGWVGDINVSAGGTFTDIGFEPDWATEPPLGENPFQVFNNSGALVRTEYPSCVGFFEERRIFARTDQRPGFMWASVTGDYANFDTSKVPTQTSRVELELATRKLEEIRWMIEVGPAEVMGTGSGVWTVNGAGGPLSISSVNAKKQLVAGASWLDAISIDGAVLFARAHGTGVRALFYDLRAQGAVSPDISILARHLFQGHTLVDWCHADEPWGVVWAVRDDGVALSLTYVRDQDVYAWAWHDTGELDDDGNGEDQFEACCTIPRGNEDAVYFVVNRVVGNTTKRFIERQTTRVIDDTNIDAAVCLDCAGIYNSVATTTITGMTWLAGREVYALADGGVMGPLTVASNGTIELPTAAAYVTVGLLYQPELELLDISLQSAEAKMREKNVVRVGVEVDNSRGLSAGPDFDHLRPLKQRQVGDGYGVVPLGSGLFRMPVDGKWTPDGRVAIRQTLPLPLTVVAITREVELGDA